MKYTVEKFTPYFIDLNLFIFGFRIEHRLINYHKPQYILRDEKGVAVKESENLDDLKNYAKDYELDVDCFKHGE